MQRVSTGASWVVLLFVVPWTLITLVFDGFILHGIARQLHALTYARVEGTITRSEVELVPSDDGPTYKFAVHYRYEVEGQRYEGTRSRYGGWSSSDAQVAKNLVKRFPTGSSAQVHYRSGDPAEAVLLPGVRGSDLFMVLLLTPFNIVMYAAISLARGGKKKEEGLRPFVRDGRTHIPTKEFLPLVAGLVYSGLVAFVLTFVGAFAAGGDPPLPLAVLALGLVVAVGVIGARRRQARQDSGESDLILDEQRRRLLLPMSDRQKERIEARWSEVRSVSCETHSEKDSDGDLRVKYRAVMELTDASGQRRSEILMEEYGQSRVQELVDWLRAKLKLEVPAASRQASAPGTALGRPGP